MANVRPSGILLGASLLANLFFVGAGAFYTAYLLNNGGMASLWRRFDGPSAMRPNTTLASLVRRSLFETLEASSADSPTVFLGDSLTEFCEWRELLGAPVLNRGIGSDTTLDILNRLDPVLALHPKAIYLMIGINDAVEGSSVDEAAGRYRQILEKIHRGSPGTRIYIQSVLPVRSTGFLVQALGKNRGPALNKWGREMNQKIRSYADGKAILYVNVYDGLAESGELPARYTVDGIHLSGAGYRVWGERVKPSLTETKP